MTSGDADDYTQPVDNLVKFGEHRTDNGFYALRMPGYTPVLLCFRMFLDIDWAINFTIFTQILLSGLSCYYLAMIAFMLFKSKKTFLLSYFAYTFSTYVSVWDPISWQKV